MPLKEESDLHRDLGVEAEWLALSLLKTCRGTLWKIKGSKVIVWGVIVIYAFLFSPSLSMSLTVCPWYL